MNKTIERGVDFRGLHAPNEMHDEDVNTAPNELPDRAASETLSTPKIPAPKIPAPKIPAPKNFRLMVLGQVVSVLGAALLRFALSLYVLDMTGREDVFSVIYAISGLPLLLAPIGGVLADRFHRRNLMVIFDFTSATIVLSYFLAMLVSEPSAAISTSSMLWSNPAIWLVGLVMFLVSAVSSLYTPVVSASVPLLVESARLESANGIVQAVQALSYVVAPILGGILYGLLGVRALVAISGLAFAASAVMELFIAIPFTKRANSAGMLRTVASDLKEGVTYVKHRSLVWKSMFLAAFLNLFLTPYFYVGMPIVLRVTMQADDLFYGIGMGILNASTILGALCIGILASKMQIRTIYRWLLGIAALVLPMALALLPSVLGLGFYPAYLLFVGASIPVSVAITTISIFVVTRIQKRTPNEVLGKVMSIVLAASQCAAPIGQVMYGFAFQAFRTQAFIPTLFLSATVFLMALAAKKVLQNE